MSLIIMLTPMAPNFASELWSRFVLAPQRKTSNPREINWEADVLHQQWPDVDMDHGLFTSVKVNGNDIISIKHPRHLFDHLKHEEVLKRALDNEEVIQTIGNANVTSTYFNHYPGCQAFLHINVNQPVKAKKKKKQIVEVN